MDDLAPYIESLRSRRKRHWIALVMIPILGLTMAGLTYLEFQRAGFVELMDGVPAPRLPILQSMSLFLCASVGLAIAIVGPILIVAEGTMWRQGDLLIALWDRVTELERRAADDAEAPPSTTP